jgi:hypothetical protein
MNIKSEISAAVKAIIKRSSLTKSAQSVTGNVAPYWNINTVRDAAKATEGLALGAAGGIGGAIAGTVDGIKNYGFSADAAKHAWRVASDTAKESSRPETVDRFNGAIGSAVANTAYDFIPGMVGIFSDAGAQKVRDAQDAIGLGKIRQAADDYNASAQEAQFRRIYGDKGWEDYVQDPYKFEKSHPELFWSQLGETIGRSSLDMAAGFKGIGMVGKGMQPLKKVPGVGQVFKHPLASSAAFGVGSGVKKGIESGSVLQGISTGLGDAGMMSMLLGGKPIATHSMFGGSIASNPDVHLAVKDMYNNFRGRELDYRDPQVKHSVERGMNVLDGKMQALEAYPEGNKELFDFLNGPGRAYLDDALTKRLNAVGSKMGW